MTSCELAAAAVAIPPTWGGLGSVAAGESAPLHQANGSLWKCGSSSSAPNGGEWSSFTNGTSAAPFGALACGERPCLFEVLSDPPGEHIELGDAHPAVRAGMLSRLRAIGRLSVRQYCFRLPVIVRSPLSRHS